ncbi:MAG: hypothetical protein IPO90_09960 [Flavobacteriales bacterium]|nr:hypothetical protein [Flavobacteriales bacterium]
MKQKVLFSTLNSRPTFGLCRAARKDYEVEVHIVRWLVNKEALFELKFPEHVHVCERDVQMNCRSSGWSTHQPGYRFRSGWVDKGYLKIVEPCTKRVSPQ